MLLIVRLLLPWTPESSFSVFNIISVERFATTHENQLQLINSETQDALASSATTTETEQLKPKLQEVTLPKEESKSMVAPNSSSLTQGYPLNFSLIIQTLSIVWLVGFLLVLAVLLYVNVRFVKSIKHEPVVNDQRIQQLFMACKQKVGIRRHIIIVRSSKVSIATLCGVISPKLLLPSPLINNLKDEELQYLFLHELSHIKRGDIVINVLMNILLAMHWFNPLLWYAYHNMREDQELACDAMALSYIPNNQSHAYALTLIKLLEMAPNNSTLASTATVTGGKKELYRRITMIKSFKKQTFKSALLGIALIVLLSSCALTSPKAEPNNFNEGEADIQEQNVNDDTTNEKITEQIAQQAKVWAEALKTRDGEPRYEMMSEHAREKFRQEQIARAGENWNFNIGYSSPWVIDYNIEIDGNIATITYLTRTSEPANYSTQETVTFKQEGDSLFVDDYTTVYEAEPVNDES